MLSATVESGAMNRDGRPFNRQVELCEIDTKCVRRGSTIPTYLEHRIRRLAVPLSSAPMDQTRTHKTLHAISDLGYTQLCGFA